MVQRMPTVVPGTGHGEVNERFRDVAAAKRYCDSHFGVVLALGGPEGEAAAALVLGKTLTGPELMDWLALRGVCQDGVSMPASPYLYHGRKVPCFLPAVLPRLADAGGLAPLPRTTQQCPLGWIMPLSRDGSVQLPKVQAVLSAGWQVVSTPYP